MSETAAESRNRGTATSLPAEQGIALWRKALFGAFLLAYFCYFNWPFLRAPFAADDMMNMALLWEPPLWRTLLDQFTIWASPRPMAAAFYLPLYYAFGLNPMPYHAALMALLAVDVYLIYRFARVLGAGELTAGLAALVLCYHDGISNLYFNTAFVFDVLCFLFYLAAFVYYAGIRNRERPLNGRETAIFLSLYLCALNSKEMAVTLPVMMLVYEALYHAPDLRDRSGWPAWLLRNGRTVSIAVALDLVYVWGKMLGPTAEKTEEYRLVFSKTRMFDFQRRELANLFFSWNHSWHTIVIVWAALIYLAFRRRNRVLSFCLALIMVGPLPIEFLAGRDGACIAIPFAGWALFASCIVVAIASAIARAWEKEPGMRWIGAPRLCLFLVAIVVFLWARENRAYNRLYTVPGLKDLGPLTEEVIRRFYAQNPKVPPHSSVLFLNDPFEDWDTVFIGKLWFGDRTVRVRSQRKTPLRPEEIAKTDFVFDMADGKLARVMPKPPVPSQ